MSKSQRYRSNKYDVASIEQHNSAGQRRARKEEAEHLEFLAGLNHLVESASIAANGIEQSPNPFTNFSEPANTAYVAVVKADEAHSTQS